MILFEKDKELLLKITNAIMLIWFVAAVVFTAGSIINIVLPEPVPTFEEFRLTSGAYEKVEAVGLTESEQELEMKAMYNQQYGYQEVYKKRQLLVSLSNVLIVGGALFLLNRNRKSRNKDGKGTEQNE